MIYGRQNGQAGPEYVDGDSDGIMRPASAFVAGSRPRFFQGCGRTGPCAEHQTDGYQNVEKNAITEKQCR